MKENVFFKLWKAGNFGALQRNSAVENTLYYCKQIPYFSFLTLFTKPMLLSHSSYKGSAEC
jgi:hypothetical protein